MATVTWGAGETARGVLCGALLAHAVYGVMTATSVLDPLLSQTILDLALLGALATRAIGVPAALLLVTAVPCAASALRCHARLPVDGPSQTFEQQVAFISMVVTGIYGALAILLAGVLSLRERTGAPVCGGATASMLS
jgi:hypothetical protein